MEKLKIEFADFEDIVVDIATMSNVVTIGYYCGEKYH